LRHGKRGKKKTETFGGEGAPIPELLFSRCAMKVPVKCPNPECANAAAVDEQFLGRTVSCKRCRARFTLMPASGPTNPAPVAMETLRAPISPPATLVANSSPPPTSVEDEESFVLAGLETDYPKHIGRFQIRDRLGRGAFGTVYRAYDPKLEREVALKVPRPGKLDNPTRVKRFLREAKAAALLHHPHIVAVYEAGGEGSDYYIASAFIAGCTLEQAIAETSLSHAKAAQLVRDLAEALAYAHRVGIVHRDVKPSNIMVDGEGRPFLMDFGLAHRVDEADKLTQDGAVVGTPAYMAPEQAAGKSGDVGPRSDQFSLGVVLYELLCSQTPFAGTPQMVLFNAVHSEAPAPRRLNPEITRDLETICLKAMAKRPHDRYEDCQDLADDLRRWQEGEPIKARRMGLAERVIRWCRREPALVTATAVVLVCLLGVAALASVSWATVAAAAEKEAEARKNAENLVYQLEKEKKAREATHRKQLELERTALLARIEATETREQFEKYLAAMRAGQEALEYGRYDDAITAFSQATQLAMKGTNAHAVASALLEKARKDKSSGPLRLEELRPIADLVRKAEDALTGGKFDEAEQFFLDALARGPRNTGHIKKRLAEVRRKKALHLAMALRLQQQAAYDKAMAKGKADRDRKEYDLALKAFGDAVHSAVDKTARSDADREWDKTLDELRTSPGRGSGKGADEKSAPPKIDKEKEMLKVLLLVREYETRGGDFADRKRIVEAISYYNKILNLKAISPEVKQALAAKQKAIKETLRKAKEQRAKAVADYQTNEQRGDALFAQGKYGQALLCYANAMTNAPSEMLHKKAWNNRDKCFLRLLDLIPKKNR
jgi:tRNA A-37 threonylcarbamoyl transferase component Bud32/tetratricopeptide (TPR) repeat protein